MEPLLALHRKVIAETSGKETLALATERALSLLEKANEKIKEFINISIPDFRKKDDKERGKWKFIG